jgi:hypothetical protein
VLRRFLDGTRMAQLSADNGISTSTAYSSLHEGIDVLASRAPKLESALLAAKMAGYGHAGIDGTLIETDRCRTPGPTRGVDLWWSGKHANHGVSLSPFAGHVGCGVSDRGVVAVARGCGLQTRPG